MKKGLIDSLIIVFILMGSVLFFFKANAPVAVENLFVVKANTINDKKNENYLNLIKSPFDPRLIESFTGEPMKFEYVLDGVYVFGVKGHSNKQTFYILSKDRTSGKQNIKVKVENDILKIFVEKNKTESEKQIIYLANTYQSPVKYEIYRNNHLEKSERIGYGIE